MTNNLPSSPRPTAPYSALAFALFLASRGVAVFPCSRNKRPACPNGFKDASSDPLTVERLWRETPGPLIGVPTGERNGFDALDLDPRNGGGAWLAQNRKRLPATRIHQTRSGGTHWLFSHAAGLRCSASVIAPGVDVRADGGYIIWWPAIGLPVIDKRTPARWPAWLADRLMAPRNPPPVTWSGPADMPGSRRRAYALGALRRAVEQVAIAPEGHRNIALNATAYRLARFIGSGDLMPSEIADALAVAACHSGLSVNETRVTLASALRAGGTR